MLSLSLSFSQYGKFKLTNAFVRLEIKLETFTAVHKLSVGKYDKTTIIYDTRISLHFKKKLPSYMCHYVTRECTSKDMHITLLTKKRKRLNTCRLICSLFKRIGPC